MNKKVIRNLVTIALISITVITLIGLCACQKDGDTQPSGKAVPQYETLYPVNLRRVYICETMKNWINGSDKTIEIVTSLSELEDDFGILGTDYSDTFFENEVILLVRFQYISGEDNIEFKNIAVKDNKFYPIFEINTLLPDQGTSEIRMENFYLIEANKSVLEYEFAEILVINRRDIDTGSTKYKSITSVFS